MNDGVVRDVAVPEGTAPRPLAFLSEDVAPISPPTGGAWLSAYVLTEAGLFLLTADSETRWRTREVLIPDGEPIRVWMDAEPVDQATVLV